MRKESICRIMQKKKKKRNQYQHKLFAPYLRPPTDTTTTGTCFMLSTCLIRNCVLIRPRLFVICLKAIRCQSKKLDFPDFTKINDPKLREIIEGSNFGTEAILKKQREDQDKKKKMEQEKKRLEQEREVERRREEKRAKEEAESNKTDNNNEANHNNDDKLATVNTKLESDFSKTESGKLRGENTGTRETVVETEEEELKLKAENKIIATSKDSVEESDIPNLAKEINETIQKEIAGLPSQKAKNQSKLAKNLTKYLDSAHDTILTATRALNDVTGYSAIEKLKKSIETQEVDLKKAKETVKQCKIAYGEAIQRRSQSQREVNELLTRKHNWSLNDLERFTELYRNDHENEIHEQEAERKLDEAESKVDGVQLKLTQLILTRYHEEQIWSDKIRRSSTWGTWVLMGLNVILFVVATFIVEPWKRNKLVFAFEDKVKQVLVGISQENEQILDPIIDKLEPTDGQVPIKSSSFDFKFVANSWHGLKAALVRNYEALMSSEITNLEFDKFEFELFTMTVAIVAFSMGSLIVSIFK